MIDVSSQHRNSDNMKHKFVSNPVSDKLKQAATVAPFVMEKQNYLMASQEIDRLHALIDQVHACIQELPDHTSCSQIISNIKHILQAHES